MEPTQNRPPTKMYPLDPPQPCSRCGKQIEKVPFEPDPARFAQLKCYDCYKAGRSSFRG